MKYIIFWHTVKRGCAADHLPGLFPNPRVAERFNLGWHSHHHIHGPPTSLPPPPRACSDPHTRSICINRSMRAHVLPQNPCTASLSILTCYTGAEHPSGGLKCFWGERRHPSAADFYKANDQIWINKSCFLQCKMLNSDADSDLRSGKKKQSHWRLCGEI